MREVVYVICSYNGFAPWAVTTRSSVGLGVEYRLQNLIAYSPHPALSPCLVLMWAASHYRVLHDRSHRYRESLACVVNLRRDGRSSGLALLKSLPRSNVLDLEYRLRC